MLKSAGLLDRWNGKPNKKGTGFKQPLAVHEHWHIDISYLNLGGTFYYLCCVLDGCSRYIVEWDIKPAMKEADIELIIQKAREKYPEVKPRIISDNGPQFIARDFKEYIRQTGMTHVRTSPYYPQSNGKLERFHKTIKADHIRQNHFDDIEQMKQSIGDYIQHYNHERLHSAIGYVTPAQKLQGQERDIFKRREEKLAQAREDRKNRRQQARATAEAAA
ncbi:integrase [Chromatiales bacterium (ex Bugula neritina AB1)]|nr:integrase [Chromatiales bacterium (ex Bugula neritina AB1)]